MLETLLVIHVIICLALVGSILLQRSEGGGALGIGGGPSGLMSGRSAANFMTKTTGVLATLFFISAIVLTIMSGQSNNSNGSLMNDNKAVDGMSINGVDLGDGKKDAKPAVGIPQSDAAPIKPNNAIGAEFQTSPLAADSQATAKDTAKETK